VTSNYHLHLQHKIHEDMQCDAGEALDSDQSDAEVEEGIENAAADYGFFSHQSFKDGVLTIGCVGRLLLLHGYSL